GALAVHRSKARPRWAAGPAPAPGTSEEAQRVDVVADQQVLGLLVVVEDHLVGFPADAGFLVAAEGRVSRIEVVAVGPHAPGLDAAAHAVGAVHVAGPESGTEAELGVVGDRQRLRL